MFDELLAVALARREALIARLLAEGTDCYRVFHGVSEGWPGLTVDRYGPLLLVQTFRPGFDLGEVERALSARLELPVVVRDRSSRLTLADEPVVAREMGRSFLVRARHRGLDPYLFLDLRVGRRWLSRFGSGSFLNLFAYTCSAGVHAACNGMSVVNVDFSQRHLDVGLENAALNGISFEVWREDVLAVLRQLAGLRVGGRGRSFLRVEPRQFSVVFMDPPTRSVGPFGAVDIERDYPSLFKPALLATAPGGWMLVTNHSADVLLEDWLAVLQRTAGKAGRSISVLEVLTPDEDFPSFDHRTPLKMAFLQVR